MSGAVRVTTSAAGWAAEVRRTGTEELGKCLLLDTLVGMVCLSVSHHERDHASKCTQWQATWAGGR